LEEAAVRPLIRQLWELGVQIDYRPGGVSMTNREFAKLERDRRMNAERALYLLAKISPEELQRLDIPADDGSLRALSEQIAALDRKIDELHRSHARITQHVPPLGLDPNNQAESQYARALRMGGLSERFVMDAIHDVRRKSD
jgi:hypothetical protein